MTGVRFTAVAVEALWENLSERDRAILRDLARVRVLSGDQLTRLSFFDLAPSSRERTRRRVLARLVSLDAVATLDRRIGGVRAGSSGLVYSLGVGGQHLLPLLEPQADEQSSRRARHPWTPGQLFLKHTLAIAELYVRLREATRPGAVALGTFVTEPVAWVPNGLGGWLKPDAYLTLHSDEYEDAWWVEVDRATESLPALNRKLRSYLDFVSGGQLGPDGVIPRVLLSVPDERREEGVRLALPGFQVSADGSRVG